MIYIDNLIKNCLEAKLATPIQEFEVTDLAKLDGILKAIYVVEQIDGDPQETYQALASYKQTKERACPKLNEPSMVMYVGSSSTGVKSRIEQHIGNGYKSTFALHLSHWFTGRYKITVKHYDVSNEILQILEDAISYEMKPAFGKRGGNNK